MMKMILMAAVLSLPLFSQAKSKRPVYTQVQNAIPIEQLIPELNYIVRDEAGVLAIRTAYDAKTYCDQRSMHLASVRELAVMATRLGARLLEITAFTTDEQAAKAGFTKITTGSTYAEDSFYFSWEGYENPKIALLTGRFWTSSQVYFHKPRLNEQFYFDGVSGIIRSVGNLNYGGAILCLPGW